MENIHAGVYKLKLRNESGVFETIANVDIDGPLENKLKKLEEQKKKEEEENRLKEEEEERVRKENEMNIVNKNLSDLKEDSKDEDKDSGLKIGEESAAGSEYEYEYSDEDYYESGESENIPDDAQNIILELEQTSGDKDDIEYDEEQASQEQIEEIKQFEQNPFVVNDEEAVTSIEEEREPTCSDKDDIQYNDQDHSEEMKQLDQNDIQFIRSADKDISPSDSTSTEEKFDRENKDSSFQDLEDTTISEESSLQNSSDQWINDVDHQLKEEILDGSECHPSLVFESNEANVIFDSQKDFEPKQDPHEENSSIHEDKEDENKLCSVQLNIVKESVEQTDFCFEENSSINTEDCEDLIDTATEIEECEYSVIEPEIVFNKEEYIEIKTRELENILKTAGFTLSESRIDKVDEGDQCLLNLLDQMKRDDQDFKVWERDDFSFLRWYVTRQMETLHGKVENLKFIESIEGDFQDYINIMSQDGVPIDRTFIQAAATIFNKDIILIPVDGDTDYDVIVGGLNNGKNKGNPLYLGHIRKSETCPDIFVSVMPDTIDKEKVSNILAGDLTIPDNYISQNNGQDISNQNSDNLSEETCPQDEKITQNYQLGSSLGNWTRMDSFTGSSSKVDEMINDIINGENIEKIFNDADDDSEYLSDDDECDTVNTVHENDIDTPEAEAYCPEVDDELPEDWQVGNHNYIDEPLNNLENNDDADIQSEINTEDIRENNDEMEIGDQSGTDHHMDETLVENKSDLNITTDVHETEDDDEEGWIYDESSGYWIAKEETPNQTNLENMEIDNHISSTSDIHETFDEIKATANSLEEYNNSENESCAVETDENDADSTVAQENMESQTTENDSNNIQSNTEFCVEGNDDSSSSLEEKESVEAQSTEENQVDSSDAQSSEMSETVVERRVRRVLKISVSVTEHDQVNDDNHPQSDPVPPVDEFETPDTEQSKYKCNVILCHLS